MSTFAERVRSSPEGGRRRPTLGASVLAGVHWILRNKSLSIGIAIWIVTLLAALFPWLFTSQDPNTQDLLVRLAPPGTPHHPLGTDELGQDVYTRLVYGARTSVAVGFGAVLVGGTLGVTAGVIAGYFRRADGLVSGLIDVKMAFPGLLLALAIVVMIGHSNVLILSIVLGLTGWTAYARVLRGLVISLRQREFVVAARASGQRPTRIIVAHILPNIAGTISVLAVLDLSRAILAEAGLSFLGLGIQPPAVSWGLMLATAEEYIYTAWWLVTFPGLAIALVVLAANMIANALQAKMDPERRTIKRV
jgi:peptide/nickel transport system permease protein